MINEKLGANLSAWNGVAFLRTSMVESYNGLRKLDGIGMGANAPGKTF